jgi:hypothetical protein
MCEAGMRKLVFLPLALLAACSQPKAPAAAPQPFQPTASIQELMQTIVDPAADAVWESVGSETGPQGIEEHQPRSDAEWLAVRRHALTLVEAGNLLLVPGRAVSHGGKALEDAHVPGILNAREVATAIAADRGAFAARALALHAAGSEALAAIDARDAQRLLRAGERIDAACESCHMRYWYPNAEQPRWPAPLRKE